MALYSIGQRVKFINHVNHPERNGIETVIIGLPGCEPLAPNHYRVAWIHPKFGVPALTPPHRLAPLTPPASDAWAQEKVRDVTKPRYEPVRTKERINVD